jgi:MoxR-like ATPase
LTLNRCNHDKPAKDTTGNARKQGDVAGRQRTNPVLVIRMNLSFEKLQTLWKNRASVVDPDSLAARRVENIYEIIERWEKEPSLPNIAINDRPTSKGIPANKWKTVKKNLTDFYEGNSQLKDRIGQVEDVATLLHLQKRDGRFRLSSDSDSDKPYELPSTEPNTFRSPETHFASYNFPFEIIKFFFSCKTANIGDFEHFSKSRFLPKFIWMIASREQFIPILSLRSFRNLSPLFRDVSKNVEWGDQVDKWELSLNDFVSEWPWVSRKLCIRITGSEYLDLSPKDRRTLTSLLFVASVSETTTKNAFDMILTGNKAIILYGPPGTGKTYNAKQLATKLLTQPKPEGNPGGSADPGSYEATLFEESNFTRVFGDPDSAEAPADNAGSFGTSPDLKSLRGFWELVQFHPSYSYHDFIGGIMPDVNNNKLSYTKKVGIFKRFCDTASAHGEFPFVFIIDEINRADLSSVFGELMYALEYRDNPVSTLQFGPFSIPKNVYLIGTMNTADKSLVTFDLALRRRFLFMKLMPDLDVLHDWNSARNSSQLIESDELDDFIVSGKDLNKALVAEPPEGLGLPEDYGIGQAYFMKIRDFCVREDDDSLHITEFARERLWDYHIEPLIEEYLGAEARNLKTQIAAQRSKFVGTG